MPGRIRILATLVIVLSLGCSAPGPASPSVYDNTSGPLEDESSASISSLPGLSPAEAYDRALESLDASNLSIPEKQSRSAAVKVVRPFSDGHGSGTYMRLHNRLVVVTAAHVVEGHTTMFIEGRDSERVVGVVVYEDSRSDLAVLVVPKLKTRTAIPYRPIHKKGNLIGANVGYTGFPGRHDLLTIRGHVASLERGMIVTNMFGWFGASGSGVFDRHGRILGVVSGIDVGQWMFPMPLDSIVWIAPVWDFDNDILKARVKTAPPVGDLTSFPGARGPRRGGLRD